MNTVEMQVDNKSEKESEIDVGEELEQLIKESQRKKDVWDKMKGLPPESINPGKENTSKLTL